MKHTRQRHARMAEELILFAYRHGADEINLNIKHNDDSSIITIEANSISLSEDTINTITTLLNVPKCVEMEEYYWNLTGETDMDSELSLIGVMSDEVKLDIKPNYLKIEVIRKK